jgi:hypothetical protein
MARDEAKHPRIPLRAARRRVRAFTAAAILTAVLGSAGLGAVAMAEDPGTTSTADAAATGSAATSTTAALSTTTTVPKLSKD